MILNIYQYETRSGYNARWIAASCKELADVIARKKRWRESGGLIRERVEMDTYEQWREIGVDVVLL